MLTFATLREPTIDDVTDALSLMQPGGWPQDDEQLLDFFRRMQKLVTVDELTGSRISFSGRA
jgi:hypothetical protein